MKLELISKEEKLIVTVSSDGVCEHLEKLVVKGVADSRLNKF